MPKGHHWVARRPPPREPREQRRRTAPQVTVQPSAVAVQLAARTLAAHQLALLQEAWIEEVEEDDRCCWSRIYYSAAAEHRFPTPASA